MNPTRRSRVASASAFTRFATLAATRFLPVFLAVAAILASWALGTGRYGGPDEPAHVLRSFAAAHGDLLGDDASPLPPGYRVVSVPAPLADGDPSCYRHDPAITSACAAVDPATGDGRVRAATSAGLTPPLYHLAVGLLVRVLGNPAETAWYRFAAALIHAAVLAVALVRLRGSGHATLAAVCMVTPAAWFLFGVVNPNSLEIALAFIGWVGVMRFIEASPPSRADAWWVAGPMAAAIAVRPIAAVVMATMLVTIEMRSRPGTLRWALVTPPALAAAATVAWGIAVDLQIDDARTAVHRSFLSNVADAVGSLPTTAAEAVASLGWNEFRAPLVASLAWLAVVTVVVGARPRPGRTEWGAFLAWMAALVLTPVLFEVMLADSVGPIWQGRYSLPLLVGLPAVLGAGRPSGFAARLPPLATRVAVGAVVTVASIEIATYWATVRRYAVGTDGSWWLDGAVRSSAWLSPRAWVLLHIGMVAAATIAVAMTISRCSRTRR